jgi:hypothetical protein
MGSSEGGPSGRISPVHTASRMLDHPVIAAHKLQRRALSAGTATRKPQLLPALAVRGFGETSAGMVFPAVQTIRMGADG